MMDWGHQRAVGCSLSIPKLVFALFLALCCRGPIVESSPFCMDGSATPPVSISDVLRQSFTADIYSVVLGTRVNFRIREHYSNEAQKSAVVYLADEHITRTKFHIYNRKTKRGFSNLAGPRCAVNDNPPDFGLMSLKLKNRRAATYVGRVTVNEEPLHLWRACRETAGSEVNEELYTTDASAVWDFALDGDYIPVKMIVKTRDKATGTVSQVDHYILRYETRDDAEPGFLADLEPPVGVACEAAPDVSIPQLPKNFIYSTESIRSVDLDTLATVIVDSDRKLIISNTKTSLSSTSNLDIDNYGTGAHIVLWESNYGTCGLETYPLLSDEDNQDQYLSYTDSHQIRFFENLKYFIDNPKGFTYNGKYIYRGIPCDVYTQTYDDFRGNGKATVVFYFSSDDGGDTSDSRQLPLRKDVWNDEHTFWDRVTQQHTDNIYGSGVLNYSDLEFDPLDTSICRRSLKAIDFGLLLESKAEGSKINNLEDVLRLALANAAGVSELRLHITDVSFQHSKIIVRGTLLGPEAAMTDVYYSHRFSVPYPANVSDDIVSHTYHGYDSDKECLKKFEDDEVDVASYCSDSKTCTTFNRVPYRTTTSPSKYCKGYIHGKNKIPLDLNQAWNNLLEAVDSRKLQVQDFTASKIADESVVTVENITLPGLQKYQKRPGARIYEVTTTRSNIQLTKCAEDCTNSIGGECETFTYCESSRYCYTNPNPERDASVLIQQEDHCDLYIRKYITEFQAIQATSAVVDTEHIFEMVDSPEKCARFCVSVTGFRCESFDYCTLDGGGSATCSLGKRHYFELADSGKKANLSETACTHYARDYHGDYERKKGITTLTVRATMKEFTPESCAHSCSKESASGEAACTMFHFCALGGRCELIEESAITSDAVRRNPELKDSIGCSTYSLREELAQAQKRAAASRQKAQKAMNEFLTKAGESDGSEYGPGAMAGVAFAMLFVGFGILFLGLYIWSRYQKPGGLNLPWRSNDNVDMSMKFSKSQMDN